MRSVNNTAQSSLFPTLSLCHFEKVIGWCMYHSLPKLLKILKYNFKYLNVVGLYIHKSAVCIRCSTLSTLCKSEKKMEFRDSLFSLLSSTGLGLIPLKFS